MTKPTSVASIVTIAAFARTGRISKAKAQSHIMQCPPAGEAARCAPLEQAHADRDA